MTAEERVRILITARWLEAAARIDFLSSGFTLLTLAVLAIDRSRWLPTLAVIVLGIVAKVYAMRIAFDAGLFADIAAERITAADLDRAFPKKAGRSWEARCRGARGLVVKSVVLTLAQCAGLVLLLLVR